MTVRNVGVEERLAPSRIPRRPALLIAAAIMVFMLLTHRIVAIDDAFISYRYAENLVRSGQFVFNLGERVEGATNLLWILLLAALRLVTRLPLEMLSIATSLALIGFAIARCGMLLRMLGLGLWDVALILVTVFGLGDVFLAMSNGLEAGLYAALLSEALVAIWMKRPTTLGLLIGLIFMTRPEGAIVGALLLIPFCPPFSEDRRIVRALVPAGIVIVGTTLWRAAYFGTWIPNSIIAKSFPPSWLPRVFAQMSLPYLKAFAGSDLSLVAILIVAFIGSAVALKQVWGRSGNLASGLLVASFSIIMLSVSIVARNGGDWMPHFRLLTQYAPCYCVALGISCRQIYRYRRVLIVCLVSLTVWPAIRQAASDGCCQISIRTEPPEGIFSDAARVLQSVVTRSDTVSAEAAGVLPFRLLSTHIHDPVGLMDPYIARHGTPAIPYGKTDINYTFDQIRPSFMVWHWAGHLFDATAAARSRYTAFCFAKCDHRDEAAVVLIRTDRLDDAVRNAFSAWAPWPYITSLETAETAQAPD